MLDRIGIEKQEKRLLSKFATKASDSKGRSIYEEKDLFRTDFQRDRDRIIHSKAFRRLMHKTQVFLSPEGDHFRTRLTHTLEVSQISRTVARGLQLNEDLTEAIALGHDLGHTPFGHNGEMILNKIHPTGFKHNIQSKRVVEELEEGRTGHGMNLTDEVIDGILHHNGDGIPYTMEGQIVKICDRVAYINHDIDDAIRSGVINEEDLPSECIEILGDDKSKRINFLVTDLIKNSDGKSKIYMSDEGKKYLNILREYMFEHVYHNNEVKKASDIEKVENIISSLYNYYLKEPEKLPKEYYSKIGKWGKNEMVKDYIAGMTDRYAINLYDELFMLKGWK